MPDNIKIGVLGGDRRQLVTAECLASAYECAVWGFSAVYGSGDEHYLKDTVRCADPESAVKCSDAVILPLPASPDGVRLNCPLAVKSGETPVVRLLEICEKMPHGSLLLGGLLPPVVKKFAAEHGVTALDYYDSEELQIKNSVPTAEGAIAACIDALPFTIAGMRAAVFGYGRVGRTLAGRLKALGADVFAVARSRRDLSNAMCDGCIPVPLEEYRSFPLHCDAVFNTIPHRIFDAELLSRIPRGTVLFELATACAGVDRSAAEENEIRVIPLPSLPGKTAPQTAGEIICSVVRGMLDEHFSGR
ncbi:MAG: dipicolinate synthase subunit DpsA [Eubacteriales bacterium]